LNEAITLGRFSRLCCIYLELTIEMRPPSSGLGGVQLWPTMLFMRTWENAAIENPLLAQSIRKLQQMQKKTIDSNIAIGAKSSKGLAESDFDLFQKQEPTIQNLANFIRSSLAVAVCVANGNQHKPEQVNIDIVDSWYHVTNQHGFHDAHVHHGCSWCGIYYVEVGSAGPTSEGGAPNGGSRFYCPINSGGGYRDYGNKYLTAFADPPVENGLLLLFPSFLLHSGLPYVGAEDRIVIAFNARALLK
jgi:uncharacterized protein (TIGR02466 family)